MGAPSSVLQVTLQLLPAPTKALVGSALIAAGAELWRSSNNPARCFEYRQPYDDDVFGARSRDVAPPSSSSLSHADAGKALRPIGTAALWKLASPNNIFLTLARNEGLVAALVLQAYLQEAIDEEEAADQENRNPEWPPFPLKRLRAGLRRGAYNSAVDLSIQLTRSVLDWEAAVRLPEHLGRRLRKDLRKSAARKAQAYAWYTRVPRVARTALFSDATLYAADGLVACAIECWAAAKGQGWYSGGNGTLPLSRLLRRLAMRCALQALRCSAVLVTTSVGNGLGSAPARPWWRSLLMLVCAQAASLVTNAYMAGFINWVTAAEVGHLDLPPAGPVAPPTPPPAPAALPAHAEEDVAAAAEELLELAAAPQARVVAAAEVAEAEAAAEEVEAVAAEAAEPPVPAPQQRRPAAAGPRLPDRNGHGGRGGRRQQGDLAGAAAAAARAAGLLQAAPPQAPQTPQWAVRDARALSGPQDA